MNENNTKTNSNIILEDYHNPPILGWNPDYFSKIIVSMIKHAIKKYAYQEFDNFFLSKKLYSFKELFKTKPVNVSVGGSGKAFSVTLNYEIDTKNESTAILQGNIGEGNKKGGLLSKLLGLGKEDRGILWNYQFLEEFVNAGIVKKASEDEVSENINDVFLKTYLKNIILEEGGGEKPPFEFKDEDGIDFEPPLLEKIGVIFEFNKIKFCEGCKKRKDFINANRVTEMSGIVFFKFYIAGGKPITIQITGDNGVVWTQGRTSNMDPPKPIKEEIKKIWNNPNDGFGLLGLGMKKLAGRITKNIFRIHRI